MSTNKFIDIKKVITSKNPKLVKWMPTFVLKYIKRILHEDEINDIMLRIGHLQGLDFIKALLEDELNVKVVLKGEENIPLSEGAIFASNHPLGGLDGIAFMHALGHYRTDLKFLVNDILMNIKNLESLFIPINKHGAQARQATKLIDDTYASDQALLVFPAGLVSRKQEGGIIRDLEWKKSFINKAKKYQRNIIPVYIDGKNSNFFYNLARFRKRIGIKANIEMFYLVDEMFKQRNKTVIINIGKPIPFNHFDASKSESEWAAYLKDTVYALA